MIGLGLSLSLGLTAVLAVAPVEVHTATRNVRDCKALDSGYAAATEGGLVLVDPDGSAHAPLTVLDGLPETRVHVVERVGGSADELWVGTEGGLARVRLGGANSKAKILATTVTPAPVRAVIEHDGHTYLGTWGAGVLELRGDRLIPVPGPELAKADRITDFAVHHGQLIVATAGAGAWTPGATSSATPTSLDGLDGVHALVWSLEVHDGQLHAGTLAGVRRVDGAASRTLSNHDARALASVNGALMVGSQGQGLERLGSSVSTGAPVSHVQGLDRDRCIATPDGMWIRSGRQWIATLTDGLPSGDITDIVRVGDRAYVATFDRGVFVLEDNRWTALADPDQQLDPQVNALADAGRGRIWIATARGLHRVGPKGVETWTKKRGLPHDAVLSLATTRAGELLVGTHAGVAILDTKGDLRPLGSRARRWATWAIAEGRDGELWLGTTQGLIRWKSDGTWDHLSMLSGHLSDNWITALQFDGATLYVGTYAGGVDRLTPVQDGAGFDAHALGGGRVNPGGLSLVGGELRAATMKGVLRLRGPSNNARWVRTEGELYEDATTVLESGGRVWVGSRRGVVVLDARAGVG